MFAPAPNEAAIAGTAGTTMVWSSAERNTPAEIPHTASLICFWE